MLMKSWMCILLLQSSLLLVSVGLSGYEDSIAYLIFVSIDTTFTNDTMLFHRSHTIPLILSAINLQFLQAKDYIHCAWETWDGTMSHAEACETIDGHPVPYTCVSGLKVCCTASNIESLRLGQWGICQKADEDDANEVLVSACLNFGKIYTSTCSNLCFSSIS
jgi:hypothetical protein